MATFSPDAVVGVNGAMFEGPDAIRARYAALGFGDAGAFADLRVTERKRYVTVDAIVLETILQGTHRAPWEGIPPTGRAFTLPVCTVYRFDAQGMLLSEMLYFDSEALRRQLIGAVPVSGVA